MKENQSEFKLHLEKKKKRKIKGEYPVYDFVTVGDIFDALTPENMNRFFKCFKDAMTVMVHTRELANTLAKAAAEEKGETFEPGNAGIKMTSFKWIDD
jgi:hypothetical protein